MKIVLATGIYPPTIGGPATYVKNLADALTKRGEEVVVVTYGDGQSADPWKVEHVSLAGGPILRWKRFANALKKQASDADVIYAFSSVSAGMSIILSGLKKPKKILRLGGDFFWERYTDRGGNLGLRAWYARRSSSVRVSRWIVSHFDHVVFSTEFQKKIYEDQYPGLPAHSVIENAVPVARIEHHEVHRPLRVLFMGRFVRFKNLLTLLRGLPSDVMLTLVGDGPERVRLQQAISAQNLASRVGFEDPVAGDDKEKIFSSHDLLVLPSLTEISPNVALEARAAGLPVLLTTETGLSAALSQGMVLRDLSDPAKISAAISAVRERYTDIAKVAASALPERTWKDVAHEHMRLFTSL
jgi:glycosyltransferase involved in cell wall biosynthesis